MINKPPFGWILIAKLQQMIFLANGGFVFVNCKPLPAPQLSLAFDSGLQMNVKTRPDTIMQTFRIATGCLTHISATARLSQYFRVLSGIYTASLHCVYQSPVKYQAWKLVP